MTGIGKLGKGVVIIKGVDFSFVFKDGTSIRIEHRRDAVIHKDLIKDVIVAFQGLLTIEIGADDFTGGIIDSEMQVPDLTADPFMAGGIHLDHLAHIFASWSSWMSILFIDEGQGFLDIILNFFRRGGFQARTKKHLQLFFGLFSGLGRDDAFVSEPFIQRGITDANVQILPKDLAEMGKVCVRILIEVKADDLVFDIKREGNRRGPASVAVNEAALTLIFVFQDEAVNRSDGAAKFDGGTFFIVLFIEI